MSESDQASQRRARAVALSASLRGVVDETVLEEHLERYLRSDAPTEFLRGLIEGGVVDTAAVEHLLSVPLQRTTVTDPLRVGAAARAALVVPLLGVDEAAPDGARADDGDFASADFAKISLFNSVDSFDSFGGVGRAVAFRTETGSVPAPSSLSSSLSSGPPPDEVPAGFEAVQLLGRGGMGEIVEVRDRELLRHAALKRIRLDKRDPLAERMFLQEAQITAQLEHPNIPPLHRFGTLPSGAPWFTMKRVQGQTLRARLRALRQEGRHDVSGLMLVFLQVLQGVAHAHARGVIHCDLKPENILLGAHGEVLVMDWGLAVPTTPRVGERVHLTAEVVAHTSGTPLYMAPEQLIGDPVDARADVFALGVILYEILTGALPRSERLNPAELLVQMFTTDVRPPRAVAADRDIDDELEGICLRALSARAEERFVDAEAMRLAVQRWLTDAEKHRLAGEAFARGEQAFADVTRLRRERHQLDEQRRALVATTPPWAPPAEKQALWDVEDRLFQMDVAIDQGIADADDAWNRALGIDAGFVAAHDRLADLHAEFFLAAEASGDRRALLLHRHGVERHHRGRHAALLEGTGTLTITPKTTRASLTIAPFVEQGRRLVAGEPLPLPLPTHVVEDLALPMGSYRVTVSAPGHRDTILSVLVERGRHLHLSPRLLREDELSRELGADAVFVPAGPFVMGGDPHALNAGPRAVVDVDDFVVARFAVTCADYVAFLNALEAEAAGSAARHVPRTRPDGGFLWPRDDDGCYALPATDADGNPVIASAPVMGVSFDDATAYARFMAARTGLPWRLPTEEEWEKAARGADGRIFPWGNGFDPGFCKMAQSRPGRPQPEPVGSFPVDTSVYGMQDAAGGIREWTSSFYDDAKETRVLRGGAWYFNATYCRLAFRHGYLPHIVFTNFGIRLCRSV